MDIHNWIMDIHNWIMDIHNYRVYALLAFHNKHLYSDQEKNFQHLSMRNTDPHNFLTKRALVSQPSTVVVAKESIISYYLN